jgi:ABC-type transporter Mla subunit MlaD
MRGTATRRLVTLGTLIAACAVAVAIGLGSGTNHDFTTVVPAAANLVTGNAVTAGASKIGKVTGIEPVDGGRAARIKMQIDDARYWPVPRDSRLEIRFGGTVSFSSRYLLLTPGSRGGDAIPAGGELATARVKLPVEIDDVLSIFNTPVRRDLKAMISNAAGTLERAAPPLREALGRSAPVVEGASLALRDLTQDRAALKTLVASSGRVVDAVDRSSPDVRVLLSGAARTFDAIASRADRLQTTLHRLPATLRQTRSTLARADVMLRDAGVLTDRLKPGVKQLRLTAGPLTSLLAGLRDVAPVARATLRTIRASAPSVTRLLHRVTQVAPELGSIGEQSTKALDCIRPYAPEVMTFATTWNDWMSPVDGKDHYTRATLQNYLPASFNSEPFTPAQAAKAYSGMTYGFPRPPGYLADQPWFQPQCGAGPDAIDPAKDPETASASGQDGTP